MLIAEKNFKECGGLEMKEEITSTVVTNMIFEKPAELRREDFGPYEEIKPGIGQDPAAQRLRQGLK